MSTKFKNVPVEEDTKIIASIEASLGKFNVLYQKWNWEGVTAESVIFDPHDILGLTDDELLNEVRSSPLLKAESKITISHSASSFVFVNFNFVA
jgi:hypothetical protein